MPHAMLSRVALRMSSRSAIPPYVRAIGSSGRELFPQGRAALHCPHNTIRTFASSPALLKKAGKANKTNARTDSSPPVSQAGAGTATDEAFDLSYLESQILKAMEKLTHDLSRLRSGGRLSPEVVEGLKVQLGIAGKDGQGKESVRLGDVAQVVPRGRMLNVICGEADHVKPISTAISSSSHSLTPLIPEPSQPLTIQVPLPSPTGESRRQALEAATKAAEQADKWIQTARQTHNKSLRKYQLNKSVLPDDLQKAGKQMEEVVKKGHTEVKRIADGARKVLESQ